MSTDKMVSGRDFALRAGGILLIAAGLLSLRMLHHRIDLAPLHDATLLEFLLAAFGFLSLSSGSTLVCLGAHIFDRCTISDLWIAQ